MFELTWLTIVIMIVLGLGSYFAGYRDGRKTQRRRQVEAAVEDISIDDYLHDRDKWDDMP